MVQSVTSRGRPEQPHALGAELLRALAAARNSGIRAFPSQTSCSEIVADNAALWDRTCAVPCSAPTMSPLRKTGHVLYRSSPRHNNLDTRLNWRVSPCV